MANPVSIFSPTQLSGTPIQRLRQQAEELEGVFLTTLTKEMFSGVDAKGAFGGGFAEETWRGMQAEQFAASMAAAGGIGLADQLVGELLTIQSAANGAP
jgi:Rod binding domain-containing protein